VRHQLTTTANIDAPPDLVWRILTELGDYEDWNPFIISAEGNVQIGAKLKNRLQPPGGKAMTFRPVVTAVEPGRVFEWLGRLGLPGVFDGRHRFELEPTSGGGTRLLHTEEVKGVLVRPLRKTLDTQTLEGFELMNSALKARAEASPVGYA